jgi:hypothetical protein
MSYDESDALREEGMAALYEDFKIQHEQEFIFNSIEKFYENNRDIVKVPLQNLSEAKRLFENKYYTSAFIHAAISIEVGIKSVVLKPILYSLAFDSGAGNLLYEQTFKRKSLKVIDSFYYDVLEGITGLDFNTKTRNANKPTIWNEWKNIQTRRNKVMHEGIAVEMDVSKDSIDMACYVCDEIIPTVLDRFHSHIENDSIHDGTRDIAAYYASRKQNE